MRPDKLDDITQEELQRLFAYDPETGVVTRKTAPSSNTKVGDVVGTRRPDGYLQVGISGTMFYLHRVIWKLVAGAAPPDQLDHVSHDRADNRLLNLRLASNAENLRNQSMPSNNASGYIGVSWHKQGQKWRADIQLDGKTKYLGYFVDKPDAISAREAANLRFSYHPNHGAPAPA